MSYSKIIFFNSYFELLESRNIDHVILHTYDAYPEEIHSDVDYCVNDEDLERIPALIHEHCSNSGWRLVQILQHEVKAFFCICVSLSDPTEYIELDVCSDYMREGKVLLRAEQILSSRRKARGRSFQIPSVGAEFCYSLWKSVAKGKSLDQSAKKLAEIYEQSPEECECAMRVGKMGAAFLERGSWNEQGQQIYAKLEQIYAGADKVSRSSRFKKLYKRLTEPSGLFLCINESVKGVDGRFIASMKPCFRKVDKTLTKSHLFKTPVKVLRTRLIMSDRERLIVRLVYLTCKFFNAGYKLESTMSQNAVSDVHAYLEQRLQKRWGFKE